jgi:hypothetical protein
MHIMKQGLTAEASRIMHPLCKTIGVDISVGRNVIWNY